MNAIIVNKLSISDLDNQLNTENDLSSLLDSIQYRAKFAI